MDTTITSLPLAFLTFACMATGAIVGYKLGGKLHDLSKSKAFAPCRFFSSTSTLMKSRKGNTVSLKKDHVTAVSPTHNKNVLFSNTKPCNTINKDHQGNPTNLNISKYQ